MEWDAAWQRHQAFASLWAKAGHEVFFVENTGFREPGWRDLGRVLRRLTRALRRAPARRRAGLPARLKVVSPLVLPPTRRLFREANAALLAPRLADLLHDRGLRAGSIVFAYLPTATTLSLLDHLSPSLVVYDCVDNFYGLPSPPPDLARTERALMARAGLVLTTSRTLYEDKRGLHPDVVELHHGVSEAFFLPPRRPGPHRRLAYFGTLWRAVDYAPLRALAEAGFEVDLIGPVKEAPPPLPPAVRLLGPVAHDALPRLLAGYDALLLPYVDDEYNRGVIPAKTYECLATGRPVLSSPLPALTGKAELAAALTFASEPREWAAAAAALDERDDEPARERRVALARAHSSERVFERLAGLVEAARRRAAPAAAAPPPRQALLAGLGWIGLLYGLAKASTLFTQVFAGRLLGPVEYGRANVALAAAAYLQILPMLGFPTATSKLLAEESDERRRARFISTLLLVFLAWTTLTLPLMAAAHRALEHALGIPAGLFALSALLAVMTAFNHVVASPLLGLKRFAHRGLVEAVYGFSAPLLLVALVHALGPGHGAMLLAFAGAMTAASAYALWPQRRYLVLAYEPQVMGAVLRYASVATLNLLAAACVLAPARLLLNRHASAHEVGLFSAYFTSTVQVALALLFMLQSVLVPLASTPEGQRETWALFRRWAAPAGAAAWALFFLAEILALSLFGRRYGLDLGWAAAFSSAAALALVHGTASALYAARDFRGLRVSVAGGLAAGLSNAALTAALVPSRGVLGAGVALVASFLLGLACYGAWALWERRP